jgi:hypothetical protein
VLAVQSHSSVWGHLAVPLLHLSGVVAGPGPDGCANGRVLVNLDLTNAQPVPGTFAAALQAVGTSE